MVWRIDHLVSHVTGISEGELWICKPTGANQVGRLGRTITASDECRCIHMQGKGIFLVRELQQVLERLEMDERSSKPATRPTARIVQRQDLVWDTWFRCTIVIRSIDTSVIPCCYEVENLTSVCTCCWWQAVPGWYSTGRAMWDCAVRHISWAQLI
jgi:hypothetical protein